MALRWLGAANGDGWNFCAMQSESLTPGAVKSEDEHRRDICTAGRWIHSDRSCVAATDGNISVRLDSRRVLTSPTGMSKGMMMPDDLVITDLRGRKLAGRREASSELADAPVDLQSPARSFCGGATRTRPRPRRMPQRKFRSNKSAAQRTDHRARLLFPWRAYGTPGTAGTFRRARAHGAALRRDTAGQSRRRDVRASIC